MKTTSQSVPIVRGTVAPLVVGSVVFAPPSTINSQPSTSPEFHMEQSEAMVGVLERHAALGLVLRRAAKTPADWAHAHAIAEELAHLCGLALAETRADAAGVVSKKVDGR